MPQLTRFFKISQEKKKLMEISGTLWLVTDNFRFDDVTMCLGFIFLFHFTLLIWYDSSCEYLRRSQFGLGQQAKYDLRNKTVNLQKLHNFYSDT